MKKLLFILLFCLFCKQPFSNAGVIGTTRWVKNDKTICIYFDNHTNGTPEQNAQHFNHIRETVIDSAATRTRPLLMLVENYMREPQYRQLAQSLEMAFGDHQRFLQQFDEWVGRDLGVNLIIKSFDARVVPFLTFPLFCEWQKRCKGRSTLPDQIFTQLDTAFESLTFGDVFARANEIDHYIEQVPQGSALKNIFLEQKQGMLELIGKAKSILLSGGFSSEEINSKPIKVIWNEMPHNPIKYAAWMKLFIGYRGQDFWTADLLWQLTNANMLWEAIMFNGDVAIFTGSYHAIAMEECLRTLGYKQTGIAKRNQVEIERSFFQGEQEYSDTKMELISFQSYSWMK
ncbi:MAG: hypothetical protein WCS92_02615 [Candidatus Babeliales bacterium]|jgi:hypothetical protein